MTDQINTINELRKTVNDLKSEKSKLEGKLETQQNTLNELSMKCKEQFDCKPDELEEIIKELESESKLLINKAKEILRIS